MPYQQPPARDALLAQPDEEAHRRLAEEDAQARWDLEGTKNPDRALARRDRIDSVDRVERERLGGGAATGWAVPSTATPAA